MLRQLREKYTDCKCDIWQQISRMANSLAAIPPNTVFFLNVFVNCITYSSHAMTRNTVINNSFYTPLRYRERLAVIFNDMYINWHNISRSSHKLHKLPVPGSSLMPRCPRFRTVMCRVLADIWKQGVQIEVS